MRALLTPTRVAGGGAPRGASPALLTAASLLRISQHSPGCAGSGAIDPRTFARYTFESIPSGVIAVDRHGCIVLINRAAVRMLDLGCAGSLLGRPCREALASCPDVARLLLETFDMETPPSRAELELRHERDGGRTIGYTLSPVRGHGGRVTGAVILFKDLTRIERLEEQARLTDRLAVLGQMAAGLAHEMRNPLAAIEIHAGLLRRAADPSLAAHAESLDHILAEAKRLNEAVATILDFVRPVEVTERPVAIEPLLEAATLEPCSGATRIERRYAPAGTVALGDPAQLRQVFGNLIRNAREAAGPSGLVWLRTCLAPAAAGRAANGAGGTEAVEGADGLGEASDDGDGPHVLVEVADNGPGIPAEHRDRVFQPFFTTKPKGSGLGLAMVHKIVQSHHGRIDFTSHAGQGTIFRVVLRAASAGVGR